MSGLRCVGRLAVWAFLMAGPAFALDTERIAAENEITSLVIWARDASGAKELQGSACCVSVDGYVLTVAHQVRGCTDFRVLLRDGSERGAKLVSVDEDRELALLKADGTFPKAARIGDARLLRSGSDLVAIAAPLGLEWSVVLGTVSSLNRTYRGQPMIQADILASPGSSGGPVFNRSGELIGLIVSRIENEEAIKFITPINNAYGMLQSLGIAVPGDAAPASDMGGEIIPASDVTSAERSALDAYNRGVAAESPLDKTNWYAAAVGQLPRFFEAWFNLGVSYTSGKDLGRAAEAYRKAGALRPDSIDVQRNLGRVYLSGKRYEDAMGVFQRALELAPNEAASHNDLGYALLQAGRWPDAERCFLKAVELEPGYASARYNLGLAYTNEGKRGEAAAAFEKYLELVPNASDAGEVRAMIAELRKG